MEIDFVAASHVVDQGRGSPDVSTDIRHLVLEFRPGSELARIPLFEHLLELRDALPAPALADRPAKFGQVEQVAGDSSPDREVKTSRRLPLGQVDDRADR